MSRGIGIALAAVLLCACATTGPPYGRYVTHDGSESLVVTDSQIRFHVRIPDPRSSDPSALVFTSSSVAYHVGDEGELVLAWRNGGEATVGAGRYEWRWAGSSILQTDHRTGKSQEFVLRRAN